MKAATTARGGCVLVTGVLGEQRLRLGGGSDRLLEPAGAAPDVSRQRQHNRRRRSRLAELERPREHLCRPLAADHRLRRRVLVVARPGCLEEPPAGRLGLARTLVHERGAEERAGEPAATATRPAPRGTPASR